MERAHDDHRKSYPWASTAHRRSSGREHDGEPISVSPLAPWRGPPEPCGPCRGVRAASRASPARTSRWRCRSRASPARTSRWRCRCRCALQLWTRAPQNSCAPSATDGDGPPSPCREGMLHLAQELGVEGLHHGLEGGPVGSRGGGEALLELGEESQRR